MHRSMEDIWGCLNPWGHMNVQGAYKCGGCPDIPKYKNMPALRKVGKNLFTAKFLHIKSWKLIREPLDHTGNEPTLDILIGGSGQDIKEIQNGKYMPYVRTG